MKELTMIKALQYRLDYSVWIGDNNDVKAFTDKYPPEWFGIEPEDGVGYLTAILDTLIYCRKKTRGLRCSL